MKKLKREEMVVMATCQQSKKTFGITAQKVGKDYVFKWAFKLNRESAQHEGFECNHVTGNIFNDIEYPGCPHCGAASWCQCGNCNRFICLDPGQKAVRCPECGFESEVVVRPHHQPVRRH